MNSQEIEQKKCVVPLWIEETLKEVGVTPSKESFGACLRPVNCSHDQEENITNEEKIGNFPKHVWLEFVSDELKDKLFKLKSDNGMVPLGTVDEIVQLFVNDIEKIGNALEKEREKLKSHSLVEFPTNVGG